MTELDVAAYQRDELFGGKPGIRKRQACPKRSRSSRKASIWRRWRSGPARQNTSPSPGNRVTSARMIRYKAIASGDSRSSRKRRPKTVSDARTSRGSSSPAETAREVALAFAPDHRAEELFLAGEVSVDGRLRYAGLARDRVHADRPEAGGEKGPLRCGENALRLAARRRFGRRPIAPLWPSAAPRL